MPEKSWIHILIVWMVFFVLPATISAAAPEPPPKPAAEDIRNTKHNFSSIGPQDPSVVRNIYTEETTEICIFCHTPHGSSKQATAIRAPIWNRNLSSAGYLLYDQVWSFSFEGEQNIGAPTGYSRLCLSCHDGTIAIGSVVNGPGTGGSSEFMMEYPTGQYPAGDPGSIPTGAGITTGDTRVIGTDLRNDHPISFIYDDQLAKLDTELVKPGPPPKKITDTTAISPMRRAEGNLKGVFDSIQCTSCHNPHGVEYPKFLRASLFQGDPPGSQIICLSCHSKTGWEGSTHDVSAALHNPYPEGNPYDFDGKHSVAEYACRNCHDPHTVQGAKKLHREGTDYTGTIDAIENTCFLCHSAPGTSLPAGPNTGFAATSPTIAPDIASQFAKDKNVGGPCPDEYGPECGSAMNVKMAQGHETVFISRPQEGVELMSPMPPIDNEASPGNTRMDNRHIECVDCHNPHQVVPTNRLKGTKGIDINGNVVGHGVAGNDREPYVFEVCLRCHGNSYINLFAGNRFPDDTPLDNGGNTMQERSHPRRTLINPNFSFPGFSNKRLEFDPSSTNPALFPWSTANTAYHPVAAPGRNGSPQLCKQLQSAFKLDCSNPAGELGSLTIQCTDCHNSDMTSLVRGPVTESNLRETDKPYYNGGARVQTDYFLNIRPTLPPEKQAIGPHGSKHIRILRASYLTDIKYDLSRFGDRCFEGSPATPRLDCLRSDGASPSHFENFTLCFLCHDRRAFDPYVAGADKNNHKFTRFFGQKKDFNAPVGKVGLWSINLHMYHLQWTGAYCHECHNNVHSNIEAQNTEYLPGNLPPDSYDGISDGIINTHLINFGAQADGSIGFKPSWRYYNANDEFRCALVCHGWSMNNCAYQSPFGGTPGAKWCAGGSERG